MQERREEFRIQSTQVEAKDLIFSDETGLNLALTCSHGRAPKGERVVGEVLRNGGESVTLTAALPLEGIVALTYMKGDRLGF